MKQTMNSIEKTLSAYSLLEIEESIRIKHMLRITHKDKNIKISSTTMLKMLGIKRSIMKIVLMFVGSYSFVLQLFLLSSSGVHGRATSSSAISSSTTTSCFGKGAACFLPLLKMQEKLLPLLKKKEEITERLKIINKKKF